MVNQSVQGGGLSIGPGGGLSIGPEGGQSIGSRGGQSIGPVADNPLIATEQEDSTQKLCVHTTIIKIDKNEDGFSNNEKTLCMKGDFSDEGMNEGVS